MWSPSQDDIESMFSTEGFVPAADGIVAVDTDGHVIGHAVALAVPSRVTAVRTVFEGAVHPDRRGAGVGRALLGWQLDRGRQQLRDSALDLPGSLELTDL